MGEINVKHWQQAFEHLDIYMGVSLGSRLASVLQIIGGYSNKGKVADKFVNEKNKAEENFKATAAAAAAEVADNGLECYIFSDLFMFKAMKALLCGDWCEITHPDDTLWLKNLVTQRFQSKYIYDQLKKHTEP